MALVRRQGSESSKASSERILALGNPVRELEVQLAPVGLDDAEEHEQKLSNALTTVKEQLAELIKSCPLGNFPALSSLTD